MVDKFISRFIKGVTSIGIGTFVQIALGFFGFMVCVRLINKNDIGAFVLFQVILSFFTVISDLALQNIAVTRTIASVEDKSKIEIAITSICYKLVICLVVCIIIWLFNDIINSLFNSSELLMLMTYAPLFFFISGFEEHFMFILQGFHQYKKIAIAQVINGFIRFALTIFLLIFIKMGVKGLVFAFIISSSISALFLYFSMPFKLKANFNPNILKKIFIFGFPLGLNSILSFIFSRIDRLILGVMLNPIGVAYYEIASKIPDNCQRLYRAFQAVFLPTMSELFAQKKTIEASSLLNNALRINSFLTILAALIVTSFKVEIIQVAFSIQYIESANALALLMFSLNMALIGNIMGTTLVAAGFPDKPIKISLIMTTVVVLGNLFLIPAFGFMGAVYSILSANYITNLTISIYFLKRSQINFKSSEFLKPIFLFIFYWIFILIVSPEIFLIKALIVISFIPVSILFSIFSKRDIEILFLSIKSSKNPIAQI